MLVSSLQHDAEALNLEEHFALATSHKVCSILEGAFAQRKLEHSLAEGRVHEQCLEERVQVACCTSKLENRVLDRYVKWINIIVVLILTDSIVQRYCSLALGAMVDPGQQPSALAFFFAAR